MASFTKLQKLVLGLGAVSGAAIYYITNVYEPEKKEFLDNKKVHASWTTNYVPSTKWDDNWDHRQPTSLVKPPRNGDTNEISNEKLEEVKSRFTRHIILVRHGQYNLDGVNDEERFLTKLGVQQAESTGVRLKQLSLPYTDMVRSTMTRAQQTGELISNSLPDIPVRNCDLIREGAPVPPEPPVGHWRPEPHFFKDGARIEAAFREYFYRAPPEQVKDTYTILVCHANVIRYFVCRALQFPPEAWLRLSLNHASITWLSITPSGRVILRNLGDSGHMPPSLITSR
ncbi:serine/threonine-protein phosphatase Pgam5, mitochondrial-like isoform X2 [Atheta coriaria]|uniref:serine/threonine-protein phosphatase Pgam5, mitochondrial-like isoform X2 n=1 Tax=Dalotia coriaria TaxID=877792 RepID=UPI0031F3A01F